MSRGSRSNEQLLLGEWACLGILAASPTHGFAISARLKPSGDIGRVWSLSRPLVYRSLDQLTARGFVVEVSEEPGIAGGARKILAPTAAGRVRLIGWLAAPVAHLRDLRSELLLKLVLAELCGVDTAGLIKAQRLLVLEHHERVEDQLAGGPGLAGDVVMQWRLESSAAALRFLGRLGG